MVRKLDLKHYDTQHVFKRKVGVKHFYCDSRVAAGSVLISNFLKQIEFYIKLN